MCSEETCTKLKEAAAAIRPRLTNEAAPDRLSIVLEPEAAVTFCNYRRIEQVSASVDSCASFSSRSVVLVVDIGGGTVDISALKISSSTADHTEVICPPTGSDCGGAQINQKFRCFLGDVVNDTNFSKYINTKSDVENAKHKAELAYLINDTFERQKVIFGNKRIPNKKQSIRLPTSFMLTYETDIDNGLQKYSEKDVYRQHQALIVSASQMESFFKPAVDGILRDVKQMLDDAGVGIQAVYLIGGFGGCEYISKVIKERFGHNYTYHVPMEPEFAVVRGAVLMCATPELINIRKADATYGLETMIPFNKHIHNEKYKWRDRLECKNYCTEIFQTFVERGDRVSSHNVYCTTVSPARPGSRKIMFSLYSSFQRDIWYITGERGKGDEHREKQIVYKICNFEIHLPSITDESNREIEVIFDFSHSEIQMRANDKETGREVKIVADFLSVDDGEVL